MKYIVAIIIGLLLLFIGTQHINERIHLEKIKDLSARVNFLEGQIRVIDAETKK
jgi:hypothetical protein